MDLSSLKNNWRGDIVVRKEVGDFTGGLISPGYIKNLDNMGKGPRRFRIGKKVAYRVDDLIEWIESRIEEV